jgi:hypothetical protein
MASGIGRRGFLGGVLGAGVAGPEVAAHVAQQVSSNVTANSITGITSSLMKEASSLMKDKYCGDVINQTSESIAHSKAYDFVHGEFMNCIKTGVFPDWYVNIITQKVIDELSYITVYNIPIKYQCLKSISDQAKLEIFIKDRVQRRLMDKNYVSNTFYHDDIQNVIREKVSEYAKSVFGVNI